MNQAIAWAGFLGAWLFWLLIVIMLGVSVLNTALRMSHGERRERPGAQRAGEASVQ